MKFSWTVLVVLVCGGALQIQADEWVVRPRTHQASTTLSVRRASGGFTNNWDFFPEAKGLYNGLIAPVDGVIAERSGAFRISIDSHGDFSGRFAVGGDTVPIHGDFNSEGRAGVSIYHRVWDDCFCSTYLVLEWEVDLELVPDSDEIQGRILNVFHGGFASDLYGLQAYYRESSISAPQEGRYTMRLPGSTDPIVAPPGDGYGLLTVDSRGAVDMTGVLPDGGKISDSAYLSIDGFWPLARSMNDGNGILWGWLQFTPGSSMSLSGDLTWIRPRREDRNLYPDGFQGTITVTGGRYHPPSGGSPFSWIIGQLQVSEGDTGGVLANTVRWASGTSLVDQGGDLEGLKLKFNGKTGQISGSFIHPVSGRKTSFAGAAFQFEDAGGGYFLGIDLGGIIRLFGGL